MPAVETLYGSVLTGDSDAQFVSGAEFLLALGSVGVTA